MENTAKYISSSVIKNISFVKISYLAVLDRIVFRSCFNSKAHVQIMTFVCWLRWQDKTFCRYFLSHSSFGFFFQCCPFLLVGHFVRKKLTCQKKPKFFACFIHRVAVCVTFLASNSLSTTSLEHAYLAIAKTYYWIIQFI